jgi:hypothetical protein
MFCQVLILTLFLGDIGTSVMTETCLSECSSSCCYPYRQSSLLMCCSRLLQGTPSSEEPNSRLLLNSVAFNHNICPQRNSIVCDFLPRNLYYTICRVFENINIDFKCVFSTVTCFCLSYKCYFKA